MRYLGGQVALITAGGGGIARATAKLFASEGAKLMLVDINGEAAESVAAEARAAGGEAYATAADALVAADCMQAVRETVDRFGTLDVLINLVGFFGKGGGGVDTLPLDDWHWMMDINLKSVYLMSKYAIPEMLKGGGGAVINTGTTAAVMGRSGSPIYGTPKSGVLSLTRAMAADYFRQGIRVNAVCPSGTLTAMFTKAVGRRAASEDELAQRLDEMRKGNQGLSVPEDIAPAYLYLASKQLSPKVTGHILMADNGFSMMRL
jgi:NAD(P)-dependent dehydrogenase (short-subunit alcohol dehydrogenase family)